MDALSIDCAGMNVIRVVLARREINGNPAVWSKAIFPASLGGRTMPIQVIDRFRPLVLAAWVGMFGAEKMVQRAC